MSRHTSYGIGGPADAFVLPSEPESASFLLAAARAEGIPLFVLGGGANILVGDRGIRGIVLDTSALRSVTEDQTAEGRTLLGAGAGIPIDELCLEALARGLGGLEDFFGMPGSVGGAVFMNARCYEREMSQVLAWVLSTRGVEAVDDRGALTRRSVSSEPDSAVSRPLESRRETARAGRDKDNASASPWGYKRSPYQPDRGVTGGGGELILEATFRLTRLDDEGAARSAAVMRGRRADREAKGHYRLPSAGSVFKNDRSFGAPAGKLLDGLGLRGRRIGDAMVSPWHANIFVNAGHACAADMRALVEMAQAEARAKLHLELEPEVLMVGEF